MSKFEYVKGLKTTNSGPKSKDWIKEYLEKSSFKDELDDLKLTTAKTIIEGAVKDFTDKKGFKNVYEEKGAALVLALQLYLKQKDIYTGNLDGLYGPTTKKAVAKFQKTNGLKDDGQAGEQTLKKLLDSPISSTTATLTLKEKFDKQTRPVRLQTKIDNGESIDVSKGLGGFITKFKGETYKVSVYDNGRVMISDREGKRVGKIMSFERLMTNPGLGGECYEKNGEYYASPFFQAMVQTSRDKEHMVYYYNSKKLIADTSQYDAIVKKYLDTKAAAQTGGADD